MKKVLSFLAILFTINVFAEAQTSLLLNNTTNGTTQNGCFFDFYDSGDLSGDYSNNENFSVTINTNDAVYTHVSISFASFDIHISDTLYIYDGPAITSPLIGAFNNSNSLTGQSITASLSNSSGDLTFRFVSDGSNTGAGWFASTVCEKKCQSVLAAVDTLIMNPVPNDSSYVDICSGESIHFAALSSGPGAFPENDILYHQSSSSTSYQWNFGDGNLGSGLIVDHTYAVPSGYNVTLIVTDTMGCISTLPLYLRVRISKNPIVDIKPLPDLCVGDSISLQCGTSAISTIEISPTGSTMVVSELYDSTTFIPDGPDCPPGSYDTPVTFTSFPPGSTIQSPADIVSICINLEHSYAGDLGFKIICPSGDTCLLDGNDHSGGAYMGVPIDNDNGCDPNETGNEPGVGWTYCWSEIYGATTTLNTLDASLGTIDSTNQTTHSDYILPQNSFSDLVGCPLNGNWSIRITDNWGYDNGYVFYWTLTLANNSNISGWTYEVPIDSISWSGPYIETINDSTALITASSSGDFTYTTTVWDEFGCSYDTSFTIHILANPNPDLGSDTVVCEGSVLTLDAGSGNQYYWSNGAITQTIIPDQSNIYAVTVSNSNGNVACYGSDTIEVTMIPWANVNLGPDLCETSTVTLDAQNPGFDYHWSNGATTQTNNITSTGVYSVTVSYGGASECSDVDSVNVSVIPTPNVNLGPDQQMCKHEFRDFDVSQATPQYTYHWSTGSSSPYMHVEGLPVGPAVYSVTVTGCDSKSDTVIVSVIACDLTIPNIITPNGDGFNDVFEVTNLPYYPNSILMVFNRWGKKIYETANYLNDWNGEEFADGTYYVILRVNYGNEEYEDHHGTLTIMRE